MLFDHVYQIVDSYGFAHEISKRIKPDYAKRLIESRYSEKKKLVLY